MRSRFAEPGGRRGTITSSSKTVCTTVLGLFAMPREETMFKWLSSLYGALADLLGYVWQKTLGRDSVKRWWESHWK